MSERGDYQGDMGRVRTSDAEIERLLTGAPTSDEGLAALSGLFAALRDDDELEETTVARLVAIAVEASPTPRRPEAAGSPRRTLLGSFRRRAAALAVAVAAFVGGTSGLALAADGAKPGDVLYGVDRALEVVGIGAGGDQERLSEAEALVDAGEVQLGLQHAAEVVAGTAADSAAAAALQEAADRVEAGDGSDSVAEGVDALLSYIGANIGDIDGSQVAELAHQIGGSAQPATPANSDESPGNSPDSPPGLTDRDPGPPATPPGLEDNDQVPPTVDTTEPPEPDTTEPPGLEDKDPGPPEGVNPPGLENKNPGPPDKS